MPRIFIDVTPSQQAAFKTISEAMFPEANASMRTVLLKMLRFTADQYDVKWPED